MGQESLHKPKLEVEGIEPATIADGILSPLFTATSPTAWSSFLAYKVTLTKGGRVVPSAHP